MGDKMYIITREDLSPGVQAVQGQHALAEFMITFPGTAKEWHENSNYLGFLSIPNEASLIELADRAVRKDLRVAWFREPDLDNQVTAIAIEPGSKSKKLCSRLKLALSHKEFS